FRSKPDFPSPPDWFRRSDFTFPVSHLGAGSLCLSPGPGSDVACGGPEKIRALWTTAGCAAARPSGRAALANTADHVVVGQHHLCRPGDDRAEASRLDAWLFERDAHGLHLSWDRVFEPGWFE